jgi:hypothetical protein
LIAGDVRHRAVLGQIMAVVVEEMLARSSAVQYIFFYLKKLYCGQCCGSGMFIADPNPKPKRTGGEKMCFLTFFLFVDINLTKLKIIFFGRGTYRRINKIEPVDKKFK